jgi:hypothetical protein
MPLSVSGGKGFPCVGQCIPRVQEGGKVDGGHRLSDCELTLGHCGDTGVIANHDLVIETDNSQSLPQWRCHVELPLPWALIKLFMSIRDWLHLLEIIICFAYILKIP